MQAVKNQFNWNLSNVLKKGAPLKVVNAMFIQMLSLLQNQTGANTENSPDVKTALNGDSQRYFIS